jgi:hypothetical protein
LDHRIVDGWEAASPIQRVKRDLEQPALLFVGWLDAVAKFLPSERKSRYRIPGESRGCG